MFQSFLGHYDPLIFGPALYLCLAQEDVLQSNGENGELPIFAIMVRDIKW